jgi:hypothetical protein
VNAFCASGGYSNAFSCGDRQLAAAAFQCMGQGFVRCAVGSFIGVLGCYCSDPTWSAGANSPCKDPIEALAHSTDPTEVRRQLGDASTPLGQTARVVTCAASAAQCGMYCRSF